MNSDIRRAIRKRNRLYRKVKSGRADVLHDYRRSRNLVVSLIRKSKLEYEQRLLSTLSGETCSSKLWWRTLRQLQGHKPQVQIPPLIVNNQIITDNKEKADAFNSYFASQASLDRAKVWHPGEPPPSGFTVNELRVTKHEVFKLLTNLDAGKATGPDGIGNKLLREAAPCISDILYYQKYSSHQ